MPSNKVQSKSLEKDIMDTSYRIHFGGLSDF